MSFSQEVDQWLAKTRKTHNLIFRKIAIEMFSRVIMRSPVESGRFRGNWQLGINSVPGGELGTFDTSGASTIGRVVSQVSRAEVGDVVTLVNNLPYARRLEYGWSQKAPKGMVRVTAREFKTVVGATRG